MRRILALQFGNVYQRRQRGYIVLSRLYTHSAYAWLDPVEENAGRNIREARLEGYVHASTAATLAIGLPDGDYDIVLTAFTKETGHGPFRVSATGAANTLTVQLKPGKITSHRLRVHARNHRLDLKFTPEAGRDFLINAIEVFGAAPVELRPLFRQAPPRRPACADHVGPSQIAWARRLLAPNLRLAHAPPRGGRISRRHPRTRPELLVYGLDAPARLAGRTSLAWSPDLS